LGKRAVSGWKLAITREKSSNCRKAEPIVPKMHPCNGLFLLKNEKCEFVRRATVCSEGVHLTNDNNFDSSEICQFEEAFRGFIIFTIKHYPYGFAYTGK
jgi:hypothetical protein